MESQNHQNGLENEDDTSLMATLLTPDPPEEPPSERKPPLFTVEPAVFLIFFSWSLAASVFTNQVVYQTCTVLLGFNETDCRQLGTANESEYIQNLEQQVQPYTAKIILARSMIEQIIPAICSLFMGPWSDKFGRKPLLYASYTGHFFVYLLLTVISYASTLYSLNPWIYILAYAPIMVSGGTCALITGVFCHLTDITSEKNRAIRMGIVEGVLFVGLFVGSISCSYILQWTNSTTIFAISAISCLLGLIYIWLCVSETVVCEHFEGSKLRQLFRLDHVCDMLVTSFKPRPNNRRTIIWMGIFGLVLSLALMEGNMTVFFLFTRAKFGWTIRDFTIYDSVSIVVQILGTVAALTVLKKLFALPDAMVAALGFASDCLQNLARTLAVRPLDLYIGVGVGFLKNISGPMGRSVISTVTPANEIGRVFSLLTALESLSPIASSPLYTIIYSNTIDTFPSAFNAVSTGGTFLCFLSLLGAYILQQGVPPVPIDAPPGVTH